MKRWVATFAVLLLGFSPFMAEQPDVKRGNEALEKGAADEALAKYEAAETALGPRPELDYDKGNAYYRLEKWDDAREAYSKALDARDNGLKASDYYNMGNALAHMNDADSAIRAYRRALQLDPKDEAARYNLEVMLRRKKENKKGPPKDEHQKNPPDAGPRDGGPRDGGGQDGGGQDGGAPDAGRGDGGQSDGGQGDGGAGDGGQGRDAGGGDGGQGDAGQKQNQQGGQDGGQDGGRSDQGRDGGEGRDGGRPRQSDGGEQRDGGAAQQQAAAAEDGGSPDGGAGDGGSMTAAQESQRQKPPELSQQDAMRLLDAMKAREKNAPMWQYNAKHSKPKHVDKDW